jgi:glycosyltransferase involved in cell wall biosynthesis
MKSVIGIFLGPIGNGGISGGDRHCLEVWSAWTKRGSEHLSVLTCVDGHELAKAFRYGDIDMQVVEGQRTEVGTARIGYVRRTLAALRFVARSKPACDVAYASSSYFYDVLPAVALKSMNRGSRLVSCLFHLIPAPWERSGNVVSNTLSWIEQRVMIAVLKRFADLVIVDNPELIEDLSSLGLAKHRLLLSRMGTSGGKTPASVAKRFDGIYVGRLSKRKGVDDLLRAWRDVSNGSRGIMLALVGNEDGTVDCEAMVRDLDISANVKIFTRLSDEEVRARLGEAKFFITASREEGYGLSLLEALAAGLPCVTFDLPAFRWAFPKGRLIANGFTANALAGAVEELAGNPELYATLADTVRSMNIPSWDAVATDIWRALDR